MRKPPASTPGSHEPFSLVPRRWLATLTGLLVVPWLFVLGIYLWPSTAASEPTSAPALAAGRTARAPGPWGTLQTRPLVVSPPLEQVPRRWGPVEPTEWRFPQASAEQVSQFLARAGVDAGPLTRLMATAQAEPRIAGLIVRPDGETLRALSPDTRARIYLALAESPLNPRQRDAPRFAGPVDEWLTPRLVSADVLRLVKPLVYTNGRFSHFADFDFVRTQIADEEQLHRLTKSLFRVATMVVELHLEDPAEVPAIAEYWGRGGRRTDVTPLLESIALGPSDHQIDISHLLPPLARLNLFRFPKVSPADLDRPALANCLWTALNFFALEPDETLAGLDEAMQRLRQDYFYVHDDFRLGDLAVFTDAEGDLIHVAVHLADNLYFTKNGTSPFSPWVIMSLDDLRGYYVQYGDPQIIHYRRKDL